MRLIVLIVSQDTEILNHYVLNQELPQCEVKYTSKINEQSHGKKEIKFVVIRKEVWVGIG